MTERRITLAIVQCRLNDTTEANLERVEALIRRAARAGAHVVLTPELLEGPYFPRYESEAEFARARPPEGHPTLCRLSDLAAELGVVLPVSFFEREGPVFYNSTAIFDADGRHLGTYRKSHIPDGPGYEEKFYFRPGNTGFRTWHTRYARIGVGICWDQWFPEAARAMALQGAELLLYPSAIGTEPEDPELDTYLPWQRAMVGHAVSNVIPVAAANRTGREGDVTFYGGSFIADARGDLRAHFGSDEEDVALAGFDLDWLDRHRAGWGFFRDRRPELYGGLVEAPGDSDPET